MRLPEYTYTCAGCRTAFGAPLDATYGRFVLRSYERGLHAVCDSFQDGVFEEVERIVLGMDLGEKPPGDVVGHLVQAIFGTACDVAGDGSEYGIGLHPACPKCGGRNMASWDLAQPPRLFPEDVPMVTHERWHALSEPDKERVLRERVLGLELFRKHGN